MSASGSGKFEEAHCGDGGKNRHPWYPPKQDTSDPIAEGKLMVFNTLTNRKEVFVPMNGRQVKFYCCGPTVYDSTHMGHARTYLTFDIMRRILSDYFMYNVLFQINITDIDDKIILRARKNELVARLEADESVDFEGLCKLVDVAVEEASVKGQQKLKDLQAAVAKAIEEKNGRAQSEQEELLKMQEKKQENFDNELAAIKKAKESKSRSEVLKAAKSVLSDKLDREKGATITDHHIFNAHARYYEREFMEDMEKLGIREPDVLTRVTEYIPQIILFVQTIVDKGMAYNSNGSVYLSLDSFKKDHCYRKLSPAAEDTTDAELEESEGALGDNNALGKKHKNDFVLWKASKSGEPAWDSPWGPGRPGWHIECSVIASDILGEVLDMHAGGQDLKFPHHDNELAQSEACFGCQQWVNYFTHSGHLHMTGLKMSKSLKNFLTIRQELNRYSARQMRILFLLQGWGDNITYSDAAIDDAKAKEKSFRTFFQEVEALSRNDYLSENVGFRMGELDHKLTNAFLSTQETVHRSLLDNFNTRDAMLAMLSLISEANVYLRLPNVKPAALLLRRIANYLTFMLKVFGVVQGNDSFGFADSDQVGGGVSKDQVVAPFMDALVGFREQVRSIALESGNKSDPAIQAILKACDVLRDDTLVQAGVRLEDRPDGSKWNLEDTEVLLREREEKLEKEREAKREKARRKIEQKEKDIDRCKQAMVDPKEMFKTEEFSAWDEEGLPVKLTDGSDVSDGQKKKKKKLQEKQAKAYQDLLAKANNDLDGHLKSLLDELEVLRLEN